MGVLHLLAGGRLGAALNSLSLDFISASLALLGEGGAFSEIGKRGVWSVRRQRAACAAASGPAGPDEGKRGSRRVQSVKKNPVFLSAHSRRFR